MNCGIEDRVELMDDDDANNWVSDEYCRQVMRMGKQHRGSPYSARSYPLKPDHHNNRKYAERFWEINNALRIELAYKSNALSQCYPPTGYIGWHNNADAAGYNLIFTWSETGDGWFKYVDENGDIRTMNDTKGWSLKAGYFASYDEDVPPCYHAAYTDCWRITQSFVVGDNRDYWEDTIDYITHE
jgi:hypothetical protein